MNRWFIIAYSFKMLSFETVVYRTNKKREYTPGYYSRVRLARLFSVYHDIKYNPFKFSYYRGEFMLYL